MENLPVKMRPKTLAEVIGQEAVVSVLSRQIATGKVKNAYMFCGEYGTGKTTVARILANMLNDGVGEPIEIDAASNNGVDNIRDLIADAQQSPMEGNYKTYVIDECQDLSKAAWDCALKLIEEPPAHAVFIFCTTNPLKVPDTIMSRVQRFDFRRVSNKAIADRLEYICNEELDVPFEREAIERIAVVSKGHVRQAIQDLQKCVDYTDNLTLETVENILGVVSEEAVAKFVSSIFQKNLTDALTNLNNLIMSNTDAVEVYDSVCEYAIDSAIYAKIGDIHKTGIISEYKDMLTRDVDVATVLVDRLMSFRGVVDKTNAEAFLKTVAVEICR